MILHSALSGSRMLLTPSVAAAGAVTPSGAVMPTSPQARPGGSPIGVVFTPDAEEREDRFGFVWPIADAHAATSWNSGQSHAAIVEGRSRQRWLAYISSTAPLDGLDHPYGEPYFDSNSCSSVVISTCDRAPSVLPIRIDFKYVLPDDGGEWARLAKLGLREGAESALPAAAAHARRIRSLVRGGIPSELRRKMWPALVGRRKQNQTDGEAEYRRLLEVFDADVASGDRCV